MRSTSKTILLGLIGVYLLASSVWAVCQDKVIVQTAPSPLETKFEQMAPEHKTPETFERSPLGRWPGQPQSEL
jgi:hypothetical protein